MLFSPSSKVQTTQPWFDAVFPSCSSQLSGLGCGLWGWGHFHPCLCRVSPKGRIYCWACPAPPGAQSTQAVQGPTVGEMDGGLPLLGMLCWPIRVWAHPQLTHPSSFHTLQTQPRSPEVTRRGQQTQWDRLSAQIPPDTRHKIQTIPSLRQL